MHSSGTNCPQAHCNTCSVAAGLKIDQWNINLFSFLLQCLWSINLIHIISYNSSKQSQQLTNINININININPNTNTKTNTNTNPNINPNTNTNTNLNLNSITHLSAVNSSSLWQNYWNHLSHILRVLDESASICHRESKTHQNISTCFKHIS